MENATILDRLAGAAQLPSWGGVQAAQWLVLFGVCLLIPLWVWWIRALARGRGRPSAQATRKEDKPRERREHFRVPTKLAATVRDRATDAHPAEVKDLSLGGARLETDLQPRPLSRLVLVLQEFGDRLEIPCTTMETAVARGGAMEVRVKLDIRASATRRALNRWLLMLQAHPLQEPEPALGHN